MAKSVAWPLVVVLIIVIFYADLKKISSNLSRVKFGDFEIEAIIEDVNLTSLQRAALAELSSHEVSFFFQNYTRVGSHCFENYEAEQKIPGLLKAGLVHAIYPDLHEVYMKGEHRCPKGYTPTWLTKEGEEMRKVLEHILYVSVGRYVKGRE